MTLSIHDIDPDKLLSKDIKEFQYVVKRDDQVTIGVSKSLKRSLELYKKHKGIRTLAEAGWLIYLCRKKSVLWSPEKQALFLEDSEATWLTQLV